MAFALGVIAAIVALRKRNGESRLKSLQKKLKSKDPSRVSLYQYPIKKIFSILFILVLGIGLEWFCHQY